MPSTECHPDAAPREAEGTLRLPVAPLLPARPPSDSPGDLNLLPYNSSVGRQTRFHMLQEDCTQFMEFVHQRDPVVVFDRDSRTKDIEEVREPWEQGATYCLWNQALLPTLQRKLISIEPKSASYYGLDHDPPVIEFWYPSPVQEPWNGRPSLTQGRVWASFNARPVGFESWYNAIVRWIRGKFVRDSVMLDGYIGPAAYEWYRKGGLLLPHLRPPITNQWLSWAQAQDQHRAIFSKPPGNR